MMMFTPEKHLPTLGQRGHSPQRYTAAGISRPHHHSHGEHSPTAPTGNGVAWCRHTGGDTDGIPSVGLTL